MDSINNNQFEVKPITSKRKLPLSSNVYLNPALDLLVNEDPICNTAMEIPMKKRKLPKVYDAVSFENSALDLGVKPVNEVLVREIDNVRTINQNNRADDDLKSIGDSKVTDDLFKFNDDIDDVDFVNTAENISVFNDSPKEEVGNIDVESKSNIATEPIYANLDNAQQTDVFVTDTSVAPMKMEDKEALPEPIKDNTNITTEKIVNTNSLLNCTDISRIEQENVEDSGIVAESAINKEFSNISNITHVQSNVTTQFVMNNSNINLSFIDRLALDSPNVSDTLYYDDDLNESNIMEIKTITIITKKKRFIEKKNTNPFLNPNIDTNIEIPKNNPFLDMKPEVEYQEEVLNRQEETAIGNNNALMPRRLFDTNSTISTVNESSIDQPEYENIDNIDPIYENIDEMNKQSKLLGHDVSHFSAIDIMNIKSKANNSNGSNDSKKEKHSFFKAGKLSKKVFKTLKKTFKHEKNTDVTLNPYEVPRRPVKQKTVVKESGIENPALNLDNSDDLEIEELSDEEHQYETIKTLRNTRLNMNVTPLREKNDDSVTSRATPSKKVRFDSTLNQEKIITGNSFDCSMASPGFDAKIDKYHDELENCINERKFLQQNM